MDLALGPDGDLLVEDGLLALVRGADAVAQRLYMRLSLARGAWFLDLDAGVPYREQILLKGVTAETVAAVLRQEALRDSEIRDAQVVVTLEPSTRSARARVTATTVDGVRVETNLTVLPLAA